MEASMRSSDLYDILACPACKTKVVLEARFLICDKCGRRYPIDEHGIPQMLVSEGDKHRRASERSSDTASG
jgi:uncharacterized protein YbaR (Trm112 family)